MLNKRSIYTGLLTLALLMPVSEAKAQGWPNFDVAKLASLITNLVAKFQNVPGVLNRINQVKSTLSQIQAVGQAAMAGDLKALGKQAAGSLKADSFTGGKKSPVEEAAEGSDSNGSAVAAGKLKDVYFLSSAQKKDKAAQEAVKQARTELQNGTQDYMITKSLHLAMNSTKDTEARMKSINDALSNAQTLQDNLNANTMVIMANNFEKLNRISLMIAQMKKMSTDQIMKMPYTGFEKPEPPKLEGAGGQLNIKDEIDVDL